MTIKYAALVANRLRDMRLIHPEQDNSRACSKCGETVGLYPTAIRMLKKNPSIPILCGQCAETQMKPGDEFRPPAPWKEIEREIADSVRRQ